MNTVAGLMYGPFGIGTTMDSISMSANMFGTSIFCENKTKYKSTLRIFSTT